MHAIVTDAFENARFLCDRYYLASPSLELECWNSVKKDNQVCITAIPSHLYHICFELFKNAMRATVEFCGVDDDLPPVVVKVIQGSEDLSIKVCCFTNFNFLFRSVIKEVECQEQWSRDCSITCTLQHLRHLAMDQA